MAPKKKSHGKTSDQPPASDPNPTTTSPSPSVATGGSATASLLPSLALANATSQPRLGAPLLSIQETHQECVPDTSVGTTTTADFAGPSTAPSASAASTSTPPAHQPIPKEFLSLLLPKFVSITLAMKKLREMVPDVTGRQHRPMDPALRTFLAVVEKEMKLLSDFVADMQELKGALDEFVTQMKEKLKQDIGIGGS